jgi:nucleoside-diphosphate kinase
MSVERTLSIIKPNAITANNIGNIIACLEKTGLRIAAAKMARLSKEKAEGFYIEHKDRPFFRDLVDFMVSTPVLLMVLEGDRAVERNREIMGATNPEKAAAGTIRKIYAQSLQENAVHGSDSSTSAQREINYFFEKNEIFTRF